MKRTSLFPAQTDGETDEGATRASVIIRNAPIGNDATFSLSAACRVGSRPHTVYSPVDLDLLENNLLRGSEQGTSNHPSIQVTRSQWLVAD